ncbi:hypothetical protein NSE_0147 [Neorickettsia sennetsu str. Miyayama]|uniref:Uncharacterized protein n=1 Tax=Ehrlichia sennetsu (strain ATCC VR-367 / Miyayama) TaxID=222891 RepID=Q2GEQ0_EHRS3|nr:hypothetical protein NSE_0147 [Neorickettsia sennetsu str. Miyayama]
MVKGLRSPVLGDNKRVRPRSWTPLKGPIMQAKRKFYSSVLFSGFALSLVIVSAYIVLFGCVCTNRLLPESLE